ncbi:hypothetical protein KIPB_000447 [Kipferlia bialata]|uniref:Uncharacterized protein n=1 Tax=Kipferlia bialata TaxID=797122 RepID=A0A9K3GEI8_9EUKA|nr:hypothetical protein KIPB_000447 [Kipferlia bialata]|eukprot:g447.t1
MADSPLSQRLLSLQSRLEGSGAAASSALKQDDLAAEVETVTSASLESQLNSTRTILDGQQETLASQQGQVGELEAKLRSLQTSVAAEETSQRQMNAEFARSFAMRIEQRFLQCELAIANQRKALITAEETRQQGLTAAQERMASLDTSITALDTQLTGQREGFEAFKSRATSHFAEMAEFLENYHNDASEKDTRLWDSVRQSLLDFKAEYEQFRQEKEKEDEERVRMINEALVFIRDGREVFQRMVDYKLLPVTLAREEQDGHTSHRLEDIERRSTTLSGRVERLMQSVERALRDIETGHHQVEAEIARERAEREEQAEQLTQVLESVVESQ